MTEGRTHRERVEKPLSLHPSENKLRGPGWVKGHAGHRKEGALGILGPK